MKILFDEFGYIKSFATVGSLKDAVEINETAFSDGLLESILTDFRSYRLVDDKIVKDEIKLAELQHEQKLSDLRALRETECFEVINRSTLWYNTLTEEQKVELDTWYHAWLDVTETLVIPEKPEWLK